MPHSMPNLKSLWLMSHEILRGSSLRRLPAHRALGMPPLACERFGEAPFRHALEQGERTIDIGFPHAIAAGHDGDAPEFQAELAQRAVATDPDRLEHGRGIAAENPAEITGFGRFPRGFSMVFPWLTPPEAVASVRAPS
jgi:hypothetical protein